MQLGADGSPVGEGLQAGLCLASDTCPVALSDAPLTREVGVQVMRDNCEKVDEAVWVQLDVCVELKGSHVSVPPEAGHVETSERVESGIWKECVNDTRHQVTSTLGVGIVAKQLTLPTDGLLR